MVGSDYLWSIERHYVKHLKAINSDTALFPAQNMLDAYLNQSHLRRILYRVNLPWIFNEVNGKLRSSVENFKPEVLLVFKGMEVLPETLNWVKRKGIKLVNYNPDSPFIFSGPGSGNRNVTDSFRLFDAHFTYSQSILKKITDEHAMRGFLLPFASELDEVTYNQNNIPEHHNKVCFLGNPDKNRVAFVKKLSARGIALDVYGNHWNKLLATDSIKAFSPAYADDFWKVIRKYRIQLNMMRMHNVDSHNMKTFEIPAIGGIQLAPDTWEHRGFFEPQREIFLYRSVDDCIEQINFLTSLPAKAADQIRKDARRRSVDSGYSYERRAEFVLAVLKGL